MLNFTAIGMLSSEAIQKVANYVGSNVIYDNARIW